MMCCWASGYQLLKGI